MCKIVATIVAKIGEKLQLPKIRYKRWEGRLLAIENTLTGNKATFSQTGGRDGRAEGAATEGDFYRK